VTAAETAVRLDAALVLEAEAEEAEAEVEAEAVAEADAPLRPALSAGEETAGARCNTGS
jgi:hypothetical protein